MTKSTLESISLIRCGSQIEFYTLLIHGCSGKGHIVFPAYQCAHLSVRSIHNGESAAVVLTPDITLGTGRFQLSVAAEECSVGTEEQHTAMESSVDIISVLFR